MSTMPIWLAKTKEMVAMDRWFSLDHAGGEAGLVKRYQQAIARVTASDDGVLRGGSSSLTLQPGGKPELDKSFMHFNEDWMNFNNLSSGGNFWPQIPTWSIIIWLRQGILTAARKALGSTFVPNPAAEKWLFRYEIENDPDDDRKAVLPLVTCWVCTGSPGGGNFEVDAVRGPTAVQLVIATPAPYQRAHIWKDVKPQLDNMWRSVHNDDQHFPAPPSPQYRESEDDPATA
jgi:hypothetical protein